MLRREFASSLLFALYNSKVPVKLACDQAENILIIFIAVPNVIL